MQTNLILILNAEQQQTSVTDVKELQHMTVFASNINKSKNHFQIRKKYSQKMKGGLLK